MSLSMMDTVPPMIFLFFLWTSEAFILSLLFSALNSKIILGFSLYISRSSTILGCNNAFLPSKLQTTKYIYLTKGQQYSGRTAVRVQMCTKTRKGNKNIIHTALQCVKKKIKNMNSNFHHVELMKFYLVSGSMRGEKERLISRVKYVSSFRTKFQDN